MVESGVWSLYEIQEGGAFKLNMKPKALKPVRESLSYQNRFRHLTDIEYELIQSSTTEKWQQLLENDGRLLPL